MIAADLRLRDRFRSADVGVADDCQMLPERLEWAERAGRHVEIAPGRRRRPQMLRGAPFVAAGSPVHHLDADEPRPIE
jgi:hypothetical protein